MKRSASRAGGTRIWSLAAALLALIMTGTAPVPASEAAGVSATSSISVTRAGSQPSAKGPADRFSGSVRVDQLFPAHPPSRVSGGSVTFEPGARSAWHTHPSGQTLIVTAGVGWVRQWGGTTVEMRLGDVVWIPPGVKHWHGAAATTGVTHLAIQEEVDGRNVEWMEKVGDDQYAQPPSP